MSLLCQTPRLQEDDSAHIQRTMMHTKNTLSVICDSFPTQDILRAGNIASGVSAVCFSLADHICVGGPQPLDVITVSARVWPTKPQSGAWPGGSFLIGEISSMD